MQLTIGIIGFGNMGSAIGEQLKLKYQLLTFDKDRNKTKNLEDIKIQDNAIDLVNRSKVIILAVKPQDFDTVLGEIKNYCNDKLIISIAAGITTANIENKLVRSSSFYWDLESLMRRGESALDSACLFHGEINMWRKSIVDADCKALSARR